MDDPHSTSGARTESGDLFESPQRETRGDKIKSALSLQTEATFTVTLEILTVTAAVVIVLLIVVFYMGFLRGRDVERREINRKITELKSRRVEGIQVENARARFVAPAQPAAGAAAGVPDKSSASPDMPSGDQSTAAPAQVKSVAISSRKPYTVQVVAYRSQSRAQSEVAQLTQKGYAARMVVQGSLYVVCVGEYAGRSEAQKDLRALKRIYPDGYLRKF